MESEAQPGEAASEADSSDPAKDLFARIRGMSDAKTEFVRHALATLAYRGGKVLRDAPETFGGFRAAEATRTPLQILAHLGDLLDWAAELTEGRYVWHETTPGSWDSQVERFFTGLARLDERLATGLETGFPLERVFQGPIADALTHVGQLAMLRRMAGSPVRGESYFKSEISIGRVGRDQEAPVREFD